MTSQGRSTFYRGSVKRSRAVARTSRSNCVVIEGVGLALSQRVKSGEHSFILVRLSKLLPASEWAKRVVEDWRRLTGSVLAEHLHYADL